MVQGSAYGMAEFLPLEFRGAIGVEGAVQAVLGKSLLLHAGIAPGHRAERILRTLDVGLFR